MALDRCLMNGDPLSAFLNAPVPVD